MLCQSRITRGFTSHKRVGCIMKNQTENPGQTKNEVFKAGVVQFDVKKQQNEMNLETVLSYLGALADQGVQLAVLPEMFTCSFDNNHLKDHASRSPDIIGSLSDFCGEHSMAVAGTLPEQIGDKIFNTMIFIDTDGAVKGRYQKLHLFQLTGEHHYYAPGEQVRTIESNLGKLGLMICYDLRFPELARAMALDGVQIMLISAQWPYPRENHWQTLLTARAIENQVFVISANRTGSEGELSFPGLSMVIDPQGNVLANAGDQAGTDMAEIELDLVRKTQAQIPCRTDRRSDIYG